ncbi:MAG TPA: hypothetical protein DDX92_04990 [Flavobacteriales bacterium]|jgi:hypothetical protein|nr:hypothetical protein [Flavobacteriales bacterium]
MDLQAAKLELVKLILNIDNQSVIDKLLYSLKSEKSDFWHELSDEDREFIRIGIAQLDAGNSISLDDYERKLTSNV